MQKWKVFEDRWHPVKDDEGRHYLVSEVDAALAEKEKQIAVLKTTIDVYNQDHVNLLDEIARRGERIATLTILNKQQVGEIAWQFNENRRLREALKEILNLSHGEGIHIEGQIAQAVLAEKDREHAKDITALIKQLQIAGKQIATLKANAEFLSSELERLRSRVVLTPAESHLTLQAALEEGEEG